MLSNLFRKKNVDTSTSKLTRCEVVRKIYCTHFDKNMLFWDYKTVHVPITYICICKNNNNNKNYNCWEAIIFHLTLIFMDFIGQLNHKIWMLMITIVKKKRDLMFTKINYFKVIYVKLSSAGKLFAFLYSMPVLLIIAKRTVNSLFFTLIAK